MTNKRIAVLIPAYRSEGSVQRAIDSLTANSVPYDVIVVDDGSPTPLDTVLPPIDNLVVLRLEKNAGIVAALNTGLNYILRKDYLYVARLDADDRATPQRLDIQSAFLDAHPDIALIGGWGRFVDESDAPVFCLHHPTDWEGIKRGLFYNNTFLHPTLMIRTAALRIHGLYSPHYPSAEDYELVYRFSRLGPSANIPAYLVDYTISEGGISISKRREQMCSRLRVQWTYRDLTSHHFYLGLLKTASLWLLPVDLITAIKRQRRVYRKRPVKSGTQGQG